MPAMTRPSAEHIGEDVARLCAEGHADSELAGAAADGEGENAGHADDGNQEGHGCESAEDDGIQAVGCQDLGADVLEGAGVLDGLVGGHLMDGAGDGGDEGVGISLGAHEEAARPSFLVGGLVDGHGGRRDDVFVVDVGHDADDAARLIADADELHDTVGPAQLAVQSGLAGEERVGEALADDDDALGAVLVGVAEVAAFDDGKPHGSEEVGRYRAELGAQIVLTVLARGSLGGEGEADVQTLLVAPGNTEAGGHVFHSGQGCDLALCFVIEVTHLLGRSSIGDDGKIHGENVGGVDLRAGVLEHVEGAHEHAGSGEEQE